MGLIGLYAFLWVLWRIFIKGLHTIRGKQDFVKIGLWFGILGFVFTFFGDNYLWNTEMQLLFWLFIGLLFVGEIENENSQIPRRSFRQETIHRIITHPSYNHSSSDLP